MDVDETWRNNAAVNIERRHVRHCRQRTHFDYAASTDGDIGQSAADVPCRRRAGRP